MRRGAHFVLIMLFAVALLATPAAASAKKKHKKPKSPPVSVVTNTQSTTTANQLITVTASCPPGLLAVGGGFTAVPTVSGTSVDGIYFIYESRREGESSWRVSGIRQDSGPKALTTFVDCRSAKLTAKKPAKKASSAKKKKKPKLTITEATATSTVSTPNGEGTATATCPANTQALGGGFSSSPDPTLGMSSSLPFFVKSYRTAPGSWTSTFVNIGSVARTATSYAYCASGLNVVDSVGTATIPGSTGSSIGGATAASAPCPPRRALLGGGFNLPSPGSMSAAAIINTANPIPADRSWLIAALNDSNSSGTIESHGYCA